LFFLVRREREREIDNPKLVDYLLSMNNYLAANLQNWIEEDTACESHLCIAIWDVFHRIWLGWRRIFCVSRRQ